MLQSLTSLSVIGSCKKIVNVSRSDDAKKTHRLDIGMWYGKPLAGIRLGKSLYQKGTSFDPDFVYLFV